MFHRTQSELEAYASRASLDYLQTGTPLTDSVIKVATENSLSVEQIKRVCELANLKTNDKLLKTAQSRLFDFPLADAQSVINSVRAEQPSANDMSQDYLMPPKLGSYRRMPAEWQMIIKLDHSETPVNKHAAAIEAKSRLQQLYRDAQHIKTSAERKIATLRTEMYDMVERMVGSGYKLEDLYQAAKTASDKTEMVRETFSYIADRLKKEGKLEHAIKISLRKLGSEEDLSGADGAIGRYNIGDHWVKIVMNNKTMKTNFHLLDEASNDKAKAEAAMGHISDVLDTVKTIDKGVNEGKK